MNYLNMLWMQCANLVTNNAAQLRKSGTGGGAEVDAGGAGG